MTPFILLVDAKASVERAAYTFSVNPGHNRIKM
jgi:hypothetical protein